ncbi:MAG: DEAD/DEAH box helicase [Propionibacteriaceae bacterium]|nr:DEAD/DEAH box helicase [Propionibacteriaceae bacterium]
MSFAEFSSRLGFVLDEYQVDACQRLEEGSGVLVAAPTGAGKTVVGEFAVHLAHQHGTKCFYTTPIKALSNQKFHDLAQVYGSDNVGLLTGDQVVNSEADIAVMTTEVLRNMIYAGSPTLRGLEFVVMDEVHYLSDPFRGPVWEEVILGLDPGVTIVALSATVSNVEEFGAWLMKVRGDVATVVSERRPVPLYQHVFAGKRLVDLFEGIEPTAGGDLGAKVNPELARMATTETKVMRDDSRRLRGKTGRGKKGSQAQLGGAHGRWAERSHLVPRRGSVVMELDRLDMLPAIYFIFSRQGCDQAVSRLVDDGVWLTRASEQAELQDIADRHVQGLSLDDLDALRYGSWLEAFTRGIAAHHAGLLPMFKMAVEEAFSSGLVKVVFATETLALGINMPARTVVLDKLVKYNGSSHVDITAGEYTQLTGRAGRRGIDVEGHAVVTWQAGLDPRGLAGLASRRTYPLRSAFTPTYNMSVNLIGSMGLAKATQILQDSFAQFHSEFAGGKPRSQTLVAKFESICLVLESLGYVEPEVSEPGAPSPGTGETDETRVTPNSLHLTDAGRMLSRLYGTHDLLIAEAIQAGIFAPLTVSALAATLSTLVYETRIADRRVIPRMPDRSSAQAAEALRKTWRHLCLVERDHRLESSPPLDFGFAQSAYSWASGASLGEIVDLTGLAAGDFVRWVRQCVDCAGQIADATRGTPLAKTCHDLVRAMRRGVVDVDMDEE